MNSQFQQGVMALHPPLPGKTTEACYACMEGIIDWLHLAVIEHKHSYYNSQNILPDLFMLLNFIMITTSICQRCFQVCERQTLLKTINLLAMTLSWIMVIGHNVAFICCLLLANDIWRLILYGGVKILAIKLTSPADTFMVAYPEQDLQQWGSSIPILNQ